MGTGEVTRYLGSRGSARVAKGVLVAPIPPFLLQTADNIEGVPQSLFDGFVQAAQADTPGVDEGVPGQLLQRRDPARHPDQRPGLPDQLEPGRDRVGHRRAVIGTWATDFRADLPEIDVPILVIQGDADQVLPLDKTGKRLPGLIKDVRLVVIEGGPHAIPDDAGQVNTALLGFIRG